MKEEAESDLPSQSSISPVFMFIKLLFWRRQRLSCLLSSLLFCWRWSFLCLLSLIIILMNTKFLCSLSLLFWRRWSFYVYYHYYHFDEGEFFLYVYHHYYYDRHGNFMFIIIILMRVKLLSLLLLFWHRQSFHVYYHYFDKGRDFYVHYYY